MIDLMAEGTRLWESMGLVPANESESSKPTLAEVAEAAENHQPQGLALADTLRIGCGFPQAAPANPQNPQFTRNLQATASLHETGLSAKSAESAPANLAKDDSPALFHEIDTIIEILANQIGRPLGPMLKQTIRQTMAPMSRKDRAELAAVLDDAFEMADSMETARRQCHRLLSDPKALAEAKAAWPELPQPVKDEPSG